MKDVQKIDQEYLRKTILLAKNGDERAFEEMYSTYYTPIFRYLFARTKNKSESEDMAQIVFMKIWKALPQYDTAHTSPLSFFFTIARNTLIDHYRKNAHSDIVSDEIVYSHVDTVGQTNKDLVSGHDKALQNAINELSKEQQEIIQLFYTNDFTYEEIAQITGKRQDAIRQLHSRALKKLRTSYSNE